jgi:hypothetical protein
LQAFLFIYFVLVFSKENVYFRKNCVQMVLKIGISGKRHINKAENESIGLEIKERIDKLLQQYKVKQFIGYTSMASGADMVFADVVTKIFGQPIFVVIPFETEEYRNDFTSIEDLNKFDQYLKEKNEILILDEDVKDFGEEFKNEKYFNAGKYIVDNCDEMIFVWDELKSSGKGGTADIMGYYFDQTGKCVIDYIPIIAKSEDVLNDKIAYEFATANKDALLNRRRHLFVWKISLLSGWFAVLFFAVSSAFYLTEMLMFVLATIEIVLILVVFISIFIAKNNNYHRLYISKRLKAEVLRLLKCFYQAGISVNISKMTMEIDSDLYELTCKFSEAAKVKSYRSKWHRNYIIANLIQEQIDYQSKKIKKIGQKGFFLERANFFICVCFLINLIIHYCSVISKVFFNKEYFFYDHSVSVFLTIMLTASYGAIEGILYFQDWIALKRISEIVLVKFDSLFKELPTSMDNLDDDFCFEKQSEILSKIANIMMSDNRNWDALSEGKSNYRWIV